MRNDSTMIHILNGKLFDDYTVRQDRDFQGSCKLSGGGVLIAVKQNILVLLAVHSSILMSPLLFPFFRILPLSLQPVYTFHVHT